MASDVGQGAIENRLLKGLSAGDFGLIQSHLRRRALEMRETVIEAGRPIKALVFPETCVISLVNASDIETEVGLVGLEGMVGGSVLLDVDRGPLKAVCQLAGDGWVLPASVATGAAASPSFRARLDRYLHVLMVQTVSTAYANAHFTVEQRLARWLLMMHDRSEGDDLVLTHEFLSVMLGVRRPGVTVATHVLEGNGLIRARRGRITILDRTKLADLAGDSYGEAESEYDRLLASEG